jgi:hypothetical protein
LTLGIRIPIGEMGRLGEALNKQTGHTQLPDIEKLLKSIDACKRVGFHIDKETVSQYCHLTAGSATANSADTDEAFSGGSKRAWLPNSIHISF